MKVITLWEPWASLMELGIKRIETRKWGTKYRGDLVIHAARQWNEHQRPLANSVVWSGLLPRNWKPQFGQTLAVVGLVDCLQIPSEIEQFLALHNVSENDQWLGDYRVGHWLWFTRNLRPIEHVQIRGGQKIWNIKDELIREVV